ncbi:MAG: IS982 family transposase [Rhodospirillales bacterium]|nr:IS982 family transposase [Rhodospirillales bacterium]
MIADFDDFVTWMYVVIDDLWQPMAHLYHRPGPAPTTCSDSELMTMAIVSECCGWDRETQLATQWQPYRHLFPRLPERSRYNRRRRNLMGAMNEIRQVLLTLLDVAQDAYGAIDSLPVPVVQFHLAPQRSRDWDAHGASFGQCASKKQTFFGYRLHLVVTLGGVILDFTLTAANSDERAVAADLLPAWSGRTILGDKGYVSAPLATELASAGVRLLALRRANQRTQLPKTLTRLMTRFRQIVETVNGQLNEQFAIERNYAQSFWGLCARLYTKLTAHTLCLYLNRMRDNPHWL